MSSPQGATWTGHWQNEPQLRLLLLAVACGASMLMALALVMSGEPLLAVIAVLVVPVVVVLARSPDYVPGLVAFVLYTNAPAVAATHHGVPMIVAAAVPLLLAIPVGRALLRGERLLVTPTLLFLLVFLLIQFVGALFSIYPEKSMKTLIVNASEGLLLYVLVSNAIRTTKALKAAVWGLVLAGALMGALCAHQQLTGSFDATYGGFAVVKGTPMQLGGAEGQPRLSGPVGEKNRFAQIMSMLVPLALFLGMSTRKRLQSGIAWGSLLLILAGYGLAFSRGGAIGLALMFIIMVAMGYVRLRHVAVAAVGIAAVLMVVPSYTARLGSIFDVARLVTQTGEVRNADGATRGRVTEMVAAGLVFADHPIIGVGPGMNAEHYPEYARRAGGRVKAETRRSHSLYLGLAAEHGLLGLAAFGAMVGYGLRDLILARRRWLRRHPELAALATGLFLMLVVYLTTSVFLHAAFVRYFWLCMGIATAASHLRVEDRRADLARWLWRRMEPQGRLV